MKKLCIHCERHVKSYGEHQCSYPEWISPVDGGFRSCAEMRDSIYHCTFEGVKWEPRMNWEPKDAELTAKKEPTFWWEKLLNK